MTDQSFIKQCSGFPCSEAKKIVFGPDDRSGGYACARCKRQDVNTNDYDFEQEKYYLDLVVIEDW